MIIREANINDAQALAKVNIDAWKTTYKGIIPDEFLQNLSYERSKNRFTEILKDNEEFVFVAENEIGNVVGLVTGGEERTGNQWYNGEVYAIYVLKEYQKSGIGRNLLNVAMDKLRGLELNSIIIWTLENNPSRYFYEFLGGSKVDERIINIGGTDLKEIGYGWNKI